MTYTGPNYNPSLSAYNLTESSFRRGRSALARAVTQGTPARILCIGDSITQGVTSTPERLYNWPARMRGVLTASGRWGTVGEGVVFAGGFTLSAYDERWTLGTGWSRVGGSLGGTMMFQAAPGSGNLTFALPSCDTIQIGYTRHSINGTWTYNVDGGTAQSVNANGATAIIESTAYSIGSVGTHTLTITPNPTTGYTMIDYIKFWTAGSRNQLEVMTGGGYSGSMSSTFITGGSAGFDLQATLGVLKPDIVCYCLGRNDANPTNGVTPAQYATNMQSLITYVRGNSLECLLITPPPSSATMYTSNGEVYKTLYKLADSNDVALVDLNNHFGKGLWNVAPYSMSSDDIHPNDAGNQDLGRMIANVFIIG